MKRYAACPCGSGKHYVDCHGRAVGAGVTPGRWDGPVDFVIAGTQKGGTTALDLYLRRHPGVTMATEKELHFFDNDAHFATVPVDYAGYHERFPPGANEQLRGEATPIYMYWVPAMERMARYNPALRIIVLLRDPVARAHSDWNMERQRGVESLDFIDAVRAEPLRTRLMQPGQLRHCAYVQRGLYGQQLRRIWRHFPSDQTLILRSEALLREPETVLGSVATFLGLTPFPDVTPIVAHHRDYAHAIAPEARRALQDLFRQEVRDVERMLGWDCAEWFA